MRSGGGSPGAYRHMVLDKVERGCSKNGTPREPQIVCHPPFNHSRNEILPLGIDESVKMKHKGYTYVFEATFDSMDDISSYYDHPGHLAFANQVSSVVDDHIVVNYKPIAIKMFEYGLNMACSKSCVQDV